MRTRIHSYYSIQAAHTGALNHAAGSARAAVTCARPTAAASSPPPWLGEGLRCLQACARDASTVSCACQAPPRWRKPSSRT